MIRVKDKGERKMSNKNLIVNTPEPKPGILERGDLFAIAVGMVIGSGMVTLIGPAMAMTGYSVWLAYLTAIVMGFFMVFPYIILGGNYESGRRTLLDCNKFIRCKCRRTGSVYEACNSNSEQLFCTGIRLVCK